MSSFLVIQTAFLGDAILGTAVLEELRAQHPNAQIDYLVRKGNEALFEHHPYIRHLLIWDKKKDKYKNLWKMLFTIRGHHYDKVINLQRFAATGFLTAFSGAKERIGFNKNPFSFLFTRSVPHTYTKHEVLRNLDLVKNNGFHLATSDPKPRLYPQRNHFEKVRKFQDQPYITIAPASVWFTKQLPVEKWLELLASIKEEMDVILIGAPGDRPLADKIINHCNNPLLTFHNQCGELQLLETAALMKGAMLNYTNDSGPMHIASAMNAPTRAVYCSTIEDFGFGPLSDDSAIIQTRLNLSCRPCGVHGHKSCPEGHFRCATTIEMEANFD